MDKNLSNTTTSNLAGTIEDFSVDSKNLDSPREQDETRYTYPNFSQYLGYYKTIPEFKSIIDALVVWVCGLGYDCDTRTEVILSHIKGSGKDNFLSILQNIFKTSLFNGDGFGQIIRDKDSGILINLKPLSPAYITSIWGSDGRIKKYELRNQTKQVYKTLDPEEMFHLSAGVVCDEVHGTSLAEAVKWIIDAKNEAMNDWRRISHRASIRVMYIDADNVSKILQVKTEYATAIKNGELMIIPAKKGEAEFEDLVLPPIDAFLRWIQYLDSSYYSVSGVPKAIVNSESFTEASSKIGFLTFQPHYTYRQEYLEQELFSQLGIELKLNRPPSLMSNVQGDEEKNTGQYGFQPNDVTA